MSDRSFDPAHPGRLKLKGVTKKRAAPQQQVTGVIVDDLDGWSDVHQANSYYPDANTTPHIHVHARERSDGSYFISMVSIKLLGGNQHINFAFSQTTHKFVPRGPITTPGFRAELVRKGIM